MDVTINIGDKDSIVVDGEPLVAAPIPDTSPDNEETAKGEQFYIQIIPEGRETDDKRFFEFGSLEMRELPVPLMMQKETQPGHFNSVYVGSITNIWRSGSFIVGTGNFDDPKKNEDADTAARLVSEGSFNRVSADLVDIEVRYEWGLDDEGFEELERMVFTRAKVAAATIVAVSAFDEARIHLGPAPEPEDALVASVYPEGFREAFSAPEHDAPYPLTVTELESGIRQLTGYVALWSTCHIGKAKSCVTAPHSSTNYAAFQTGLHDDIPVGVLTMDTGHAKIRLNLENTVRHYDDTGTVAAYIQLSENEHGILMTGYVEPALDDTAIRRLTACSVSGDWRYDPKAKNLELAAVLAVPTPGFQTPRAFEAAPGKQLSLVAAGSYCRPCAEPIETIDDILEAHFGVEIAEIAESDLITYIDKLLDRVE